MPRLFFTLTFVFYSFYIYSQDINVYLIGDTGLPLGSPSTFQYLTEVVEKGKDNDILIVLGDNIYPDGLPEPESNDRKLMEERLNVMLDIMDEFKGESYIIPGNHDWSQGGLDGWKKVLNQQDYVDQYLGSIDNWQPRNGCPGPVQVQISPNMVLIILDTQYFLHPWDKPTSEDGCTPGSTADALRELQFILKQNKDKNIIVAGHHPIYSYGPHGSKYRLKQHIFPLTEINKKLWIPLPVIGSIYPLFRSWFGSRQDIPHPKYSSMKNAMHNFLKEVPNAVYVSGHEHSLQYIMEDSVHYVVSGAGCKSSNVGKGSGTMFRRQTHGFAQLIYEEKGDVILKMYDGDRKSIIYNKTIFSKKVLQAEEKPLEESVFDSLVIRPVSEQYKASGTKKYWLGENYRKVWSAPVEMPVFNMREEQGGLKVLKMGGGNQTRSLRLADSSGREYNIRSLEKYPGKLLPPALHETLMADILQDQISAANPYGAFAVAPLAEPLGIYHTNPKLVFLPDDPRFGIYRPYFANIPAMFVERPNDEAAGQPFFGGGTDIDGTNDVLNELHSDNDEIIDQPYTLRCRLFDMVIGDWDRHDDQWRWTKFDKQPKGHVWRPIPRDRDQVFFDSDGIFGWLASRKFALPNTEGFDEHMDYPPGFNASARYFDRTFIHELTWEEWKEQIDFIQKHLTDDVIESAIRSSWPDTIYQLVGQQTIRVLKARRDDMERYARIHYLFLSEEVEVVGSHKHEYFLIERLDDQTTKVTVHKRDNDSGKIEQEIYSRLFQNKETNEIRLYGLGGEDVFELKGKVDKGIKIRIIGGLDDDKVIDNSNVSDGTKKTIVYDLKKSTEVEKSEETKLKLSNQPSINIYDRKAFKYNKMLPLITAQFNPDDGIFLGAGFIYTKHHWRKKPFAHRQELSGNVALATGAVNLNYNGTVTDVIGQWDLNGDFSLQQPYGVDNYFGFGNETSFDFRGNGEAAAFEREIDFYRIRYQRSSSFLNLSYGLGAKGAFRVGAEHISYRVQDEVQDAFINTDPDIDQSRLYKSRQLVGPKVSFKADTRNHKHLPSSGLYAHLSSARYFGLNRYSQDFTQFNAELSFLISTHDPSRITLANRIGLENNDGDIDFFTGAHIGRTNVRGYRRTRFTGHAALYHNLDLRVSLFSFRTYLFPVGVGLIGFHDIGRVYYQGENSNEWHTSKGAGLWLSPLNQVVLAINMAFTEDENLPFVTFGFHF